MKLASTRDSHSITVFVGYGFRRPRRAFAVGAGQTDAKQEFLAVTKEISVLPTETHGKEITRFNALKHGILYRVEKRPVELGWD